MKILLCLNQDIYCVLAFNYLLPHIKNHQINICFSNGFGVAPDNKNMRDLLDCERDLSINNIQLVVEKSGVKIDLENFFGFEQIKQKFSVLSFKNINTDGLEYLSTNWQPDLIISIRFGQIFKSQVIALPKFGIVNLHSGVLPSYRGILATFWSMLNGESDIGTTLHFVNDDSIDTGDIISIAKNKVDYEQSLMINIFRLYPAGVRLIVDFIDCIKNNLVPKVVKQDKQLGRYFSYPMNQDLEDFLELGLILK